MKLLLIALLAAPLMGQSANVVKLQPEDSAEAKDIYAQRALLDKREAVLRNKISSYPALATTSSNGIITFNSPWSTGFEFDESFTYVVPKSRQVPQMWGNQYCYTMPVGVDSIAGHTGYVGVR